MPVGQLTFIHYVNFDPTLRTGSGVTRLISRAGLGGVGPLSTWLVSVDWGAHGSICPAPLELAMGYVCPTPCTVRTCSRQVLGVAGSIVASTTARTHRWLNAPQCLLPFLNARLAGKPKPRVHAV